MRTATTCLFGIAATIVCLTAGWRMRATTLAAPCAWAAAALLLVTCGVASAAFMHDPPLASRCQHAGSLCGPAGRQTSARPRLAIDRTFARRTARFSGSPGLVRRPRASALASPFLALVDGGAAAHAVAQLSAHTVCGGGLSRILWT